MKNLLLASSCLLFANLAIASSNNGVYISSKIGVSVLNMYDSKLKSASLSDPNFSTINFSDKSHSAFGNYLAIGYNFYDQFSLPIRSELELGMRGKIQNNYNVAKVSTPSGIDASTDMKNEATLTTVMLNGYYDMKNQTQFTPYISFGLGLASTRYDRELQTFLQTPSSKSTDLNSASERINKLAWSIGFGSQYAWSDNLLFDMSYRFLDAGKYQITTKDAFDPGDTHKSQFNLASHDFMFGVAYRF
ncbi:outer membrane beta-barrel protein [Providencia sp. PROV188]|uniref:outer membrane protein n=1 Tax=Providencia TaxID=586 RepID=UPI0003E297F3|nr:MULTISPECIES: outer membrane beta-barrel protein [Providencia]ETT01335.1 outer membrane protein beta-barrel domain protein [Providencia alcalifaciens PAL-3]EUC99054.1 outer membrane protein beta-barrel domain protein [Providencia alcalifaciens PAL-1]MBG5884022.1 porin family protein [Providencia alcalifaciens]MTB44779.1 outer membrane beta-barrel protein [Providencia sp. wls1950]MTC41912.1 outer membrane beta-barrel protein [Providencia sp. wls1921]